METKKSIAYLRAKKKVEVLKGFYSHLIAFVLVNIGVILVTANVFNKKPVDFEHWSNYLIVIFWGFGLVSHAIYVFFEINFENDLLKRWEAKKLKQFLEEER